MKASELRIGNFIESIHSKNLLFTKVDVSLFVGLEKETINEDDLKPILLTREWLIKFGFKYYKTPNKNGCFKLNRGSKKTDNLQIFSLYCYGSFGYGIKQNYYQKSKYVHQLQNMYFTLTGQELTIEK